MEELFNLETMKKYLILLCTILKYILAELSILLLIPTAYILYPFIYWGRNNFIRNIFWIYFNDSVDGDFGDHKWQIKQSLWKPRNKWQWFLLSYKWNVMRNPVFNYVNNIIGTPNTSIKDFNSEIILCRNNNKITALNMASFDRNLIGYGLFLFKLKNSWYFSFSSLFYAKNYKIEIIFAHHLTRYVFHIKFHKVK